MNTNLPNARVFSTVISPLTFCMDSCLCGVIVASMILFSRRTDFGRITSYLTCTHVTCRRIDIFTSLSLLVCELPNRLVVFGQRECQMPSVWRGNIQQCLGSTMPKLQCWSIPSKQPTSIILCILSTRVHVRFR